MRLVEPYTFKKFIHLSFLVVFWIIWIIEFFVVFVFVFAEKVGLLNQVLQDLDWNVFGFFILIVDWLNDFFVAAFIDSLKRV